jgi:predicted heme/steroid binding protein
MRRFSRAQLSLYSGTDGMPAYIAYRGRVYDVTNSFLWQQGRHQVLHAAGRDLTVEMDEAPHGAELLERVPVIGILVD